MRRGELIAGRFEIDRPAGSGGMGQVYRAIDRDSGGPVALKIMRGQAPQERDRFVREAQILGSLAHPGVARHVAHGVLADGTHYLAMDWLEGETLAQRLAREGLSLSESVGLGVRIGQALAAVHRHGVVHRDLKPGNIVLRNGRLEEVTLIDFGIALLPDTLQLTLPGTMLGTPAYMAPEQARSAPEVDSRADVFSLGCVLYKCITGRGPFLGDDGLSVLLKVVLEDPPGLSQLRDDVPPALEAVVMRMLAKTPAQRPRDGAAVVQALEGLGPMPDAVGFSSQLPVRSQVPPRPSVAPPVLSPLSLRPTLGAAPVLTSAERRGMCLVLAREPPVGPGRARSPAQLAAREQALREAAARHQGELELLADRSIFVVLQSAAAATDLAATAARCALALRRLLDEGNEGDESDDAADAVPLRSTPMAIVSGRGVLSSRLPVGEMIDRAVGLLGEGPGGAPGILLDEVTAGLLDARFEVVAEGARIRLRGERGPFEAARTLLGGTTPFVGRDRELSQLEAAFQACADESSAAVILVTGGAGMGKSRLGYELVQRLRRRIDPPALWIGRGDPISAGSAFNLLGQALRGALGIADGDPLPARRARLRARVEQHGLAEPERVVGFLGELLGVPSAEESLQLRAAHRDPMLMGDQMRRAFEDFLRAECAVAPVVLVLEDLHWGDLPTVKFVDAALRNLGDQRLLVLALARPEVHSLFPRLWAGRGLHEVELRELPRRAGERLVRRVLGEATPAETVREIVERADGNAFYLEELIRAVASGKGGAMPETVLAMVQARLEALDAEARRVLRAASVFGQTFWAGGVSALLGGASIEIWLASLVELELCTPSHGGRFPGEVEYAFRHALIREAAYTMLTEGDMVLGHALAAEWLEQAGEGDAMVLAEHKERGGEPARAAIWYRRAAEEAFEGNDLEAAIARAGKGAACLAETTLAFAPPEPLDEAGEGDAPASSTETSEPADRPAPPSMAPSSILPPSLAPSSMLPPSLTPSSMLPPSSTPSSMLPPSMAPRSLPPPSLPPLSIAPHPEERSLDGEWLGELRLLQATAHKWRGENSEAERCGLEAMRLLRAGCAAFCDAAGEVVLASGKLGHVELLVSTAEQLRAVRPTKNSAAALAIAMTRAAFNLRFADRGEQAEALLERAAEVATLSGGDPVVLGQLQSARASRSLADGDVGDYLRRMEDSWASFEQVGDLRGACARAMNVGYARLSLGANAEAERALRAAIGQAERLGLHNVRAYGKHNLGLALGHQGKLDEGRAAEEEAIRAFRAQGDRRMEAASRIYLAMLQLLAGDAEGAVREAAAVTDDAACAQPIRAGALSVQADALLAAGQIERALAAAREAMDILEGLTGIEEGESLIRLAFAEALAAHGDLPAARAAIREARERLLRRAAKVGDPALRQSFLERVPENARTLARARELLGEPAPSA
jgi:tetratricopeptide (TPR) repeat protein